MAEQMMPTGMVPGLVTVKKKDGTLQNLWPIDAKELIAAGDAELVENGSAEAARLNVNPLRSGRSTAKVETVAAEITGISGSVIVSADEKAADKVRDAGNNADATSGEAQTATIQNKSVPPKASEAKAADKK